MRRMNPTTGEIRQFTSTAAAIAEGFILELERAPNPNCNQGCYGRGYTGEKVGGVHDGQKALCICVLPKTVNPFKETA